MSNPRCSASDRQEQIEDAHREADKQVLNRVHEDATRDLPRERDDEGHDDEEHGVFHCPFGLHVDVHRLDQCHAE